MRFSGRNTEKVTLKRRVVGTNSYNEQVEDWDQNDQEIYAEFWEKHGTEGLKEGHITVIKEIHCKIRYINGLNETDYCIQRGAQIYDVLSVKPIHRNQAQELLIRVNETHTSTVITGDTSHVPTNEFKLVEVS